MNSEVIIKVMHDIASASLDRHRSFLLIESRLKREADHANHAEAAKKTTGGSGYLRRFEEAYLEYLDVFENFKRDSEKIFKKIYDYE